MKVLRSPTISVRVFSVGHIYSYLEVNQGLRSHMMQKLFCLVASLLISILLIKCARMQSSGNLPLVMSQSYTTDPSPLFLQFKVVYLCIFHF